MIIKSMARKHPGFGQLVGYFDKGQVKGTTPVFTRNLYAENSDASAIQREFEANFGYLPKRKNGNALYHEILVLDQNTGLSPEQENTILLDLAAYYVDQRAPNQLVYGKVHDDQSHRHIHLMISSNAVKSDRRLRVTKARFAEIQKAVEERLLSRYPELGAERIYTRGDDRQALKQSSREGELERRTRKPSRKRQLQATLHQTFSQASSSDALEKQLHEQGLRLYVRGRQVGVEPLQEGRRFRLKTLGVQSAYEDMLVRFERQATQMDVREPVGAEPPRGAPELDERAAALLKDRQGMERFAEHHLRDDQGER